MLDDWLKQVKDAQSSQAAYELADLIAVDQSETFLNLQQALNVSKGQSAIFGHMTAKSQGTVYSMRRA